MWEIIRRYLLVWTLIAVILVVISIVINWGILVICINAVFHNFMIGIIEVVGIVFLLVLLLGSFF